MLLTRLKNLSINNHIKFDVLLEKASAVGVGELPNAVVNWGEMGKSCGKREAFSRVFAHGA
jgi:hypothetical protein